MIPARLDARRDVLIVLMAHIAITAAITWPSVAHLSDAVSDPGDPYINSWVLDWVQHALTSDAKLFDANIFHPARTTLALSEHLFGPAVVSFPLRWMEFDPVTIHNVLLFASFPLLGLATHILARISSIGFSASFIASILAAYNPWRFTHITHLQDMWAASIPFLIGAIVFWFQKPTIRRSVLVGLAFVFNATGNLHWLVFGTAAGILSFVTLLILRKPRFADCANLALIVLVAVLLVVPLLSPYVRMLDDRTTVDRAGEVSFYSARPGDWLTAGFSSHFWTGFRNDGSTNPERWLFPGAILSGLALIAPFAWRGVSQANRDALLVGAVLLLVGFLGSLGLNAFFHQILFEHIPGFRNIRVPARWAVVAHVGMALMAAAALHSILQQFERSSARRAAIAILSIAALVELRAAPMNLFHIPEKSARVHEWLRTIPATTVIVELPPDQSLEYRYMLAATRHHLRTMNGVSGSEPESHQKLREAWASPDHGTLSPLFQEAGVSIIVVHTDALGEAAERARRWIAGELRAGRLTFLESFPANIGRDLVFAREAGLTTSARPDANDQDDLSVFLEGGLMRPRSPIGFVESPTLHSVIAGPELEVRGWALSDVPISHVMVTIEGSGRRKADLFPYPAINDDFPGVEPGRQSGFRARFRRPDRLLRHPRHVRVEIIDQTGRRKRLEQIPFTWAEGS